MPNRLQTLQSKQRALQIYLGRRILAARNARGLSQKDAAAALGVSHQQFHKYEAGIDRVPAGRLPGLAKCLSVKVAWFFHGMAEASVIADRCVIDANVADFLIEMLAAKNPDLRKLARTMVQSSSPRPQALAKRRA